MPLRFQKTSDLISSPVNQNILISEKGAEKRIRKRLAFAFLSPSPAYSAASHAWRTFCSGIAESRADTHNRLVRERKTQYSSYLSDSRLRNPARPWYGEERGSKAPKPLFGLLSLVFLFPLIRFLSPFGISLFRVQKFTMSPAPKRPFDSFTQVTK